MSRAKRILPAASLAVALTVATAGCATPYGRGPLTQEQRDRQDRLDALERGDKQRRKDVRITNNADAVRGCELMGGITRFEKVKRFQADVSSLGGNVGYVVATNEDGEMIGEAYLCEQPKP